MKERKRMNETNTELLTTDSWPESNVIQSVWDSVQLMNGKWDTALSNNSPGFNLVKTPLSNRLPGQYGIMFKI